MKELTIIRFGIAVLLFLSCACRDSGKPSDKDIVRKPELLEDRIRENLQVLAEYAGANDGRINDTTALLRPALINQVYEQNGYTPVWTSSGQLNTLGDSLLHFIGDARAYGLFPSNYHYRQLSLAGEQLRRDSLTRKDAALLSRTDVLFTDALFEVARDLKRGRLPYDSLTIRKDTVVIDDDFFKGVLNAALSTRAVHTVLANLEPNLPGYMALKQGLRKYVDTTKFQRYTYLPYPINDSTQFQTLLRARLIEERLFDSVPAITDTAAIRAALARFQKSKNLKVTGKTNVNTVKALNDTDTERFKRAAISLDKFKLMPDTLPHNYVWVNIPAYQLKVVEDDSLVLESKVIVGTAQTRTPELYSEISNFITYPQWTVPYSIIFKEMLPQIQKDTNYLKKQNLMVVDKNDSVIPPSQIKWSKLSKKYFPYLIKQRQGDDNSLGVLKFNFRNKYAVYLHDTNARWLFSRKDRALSHGCVRVQNWEELAHYLVRNDTVKYHPDTLVSWIVRQEKHVVSGFKKVPLYIRYFTVEGVNGALKFYEDIYADDKVLAERYFSKNIY